MNNINWEKQFHIQDSISEIRDSKFIILNIYILNIELSRTSHIEIRYSKVQYLKQQIKRTLLN